MEEAKEARLAEFLNTRFFLLKIIYNSNLDSEVNGKEGVCITDCHLRLEKKISRSVGHAELCLDVKRLQDYGLVIAEETRGGKKFVKLTPECRIIFDKLVEVAGRIQ